MDPKQKPGSVNEPTTPEELFAQIADDVRGSATDERPGAGAPETKPPQDQNESLDQRESDDKPGSVEDRIRQLEEELGRTKAELAVEARQRAGAQTRYFELQTEINKLKQAPPADPEVDPDETIGQEFQKIYTKHYERLARKFPDYEEAEIGRRAHAAASEDYLDAKIQRTTKRVLAESPITQNIESAQISNRMAAADAFYTGTVLKTLGKEGQALFLQELNREIAAHEKPNGPKFVVGGKDGWSMDAWKALDIPAMAERTFDIVYGRLARRGKLQASQVDGKVEDAAGRSRRVAVPQGSGNAPAPRDRKTGKFVIPDRGENVPADVVDSLDDGEWASLIASAGKF